MKDQEHRHTHQESSPNSRDSRHPRNSFKSHPPKRSSSKLIGQVFGLIYNLALLYLIYDLAQSGSEKLALGLFAINAGLILFAAISAKRSFNNKSNSSYNRDGRNNRSRFPRQSTSR